MEQCCGRAAAATPTNADLHSGRYNVARAATWKLFKRLGLTWLCCGVCVGSYAAALAIARTGADEQDCSHTCKAPFRTDNGTVLLVGDSITAGYFPDVAGIVDGRAPAAACYDAGHTGGQSSIAGVILGRFGSGDGWCGTSHGVLQCVDGYLNQLNANLSVIHFNWGLHDIDPHIYRTHISHSQYYANMEKLYLTFKRAAPAATVVFQTTTPVPPSYTRGRDNKDVIAINDVAKTLFGPTGKYPEVIINDLYQHIVDVCHNDPESTCYPETCDCPHVQDDGVHFSPAGRRFNALMVASTIAPMSTGPTLLAAGRTPPEKRDVAEWRPWELAFFIQLGFLGGLFLVIGGAVLLRRKLARGPAAAASDGGETKDPA